MSNIDTTKDPELQAAARQDLELVKRALARGPGAFEELGERLRVVPRLLAVANRRLARPLLRDELMDLAQDTIVMIWQKLETFEGRGTLEGWASRFCVLELKNRSRAVASRNLRQGASLDAIPIEPVQPTPEPMRIDSEELKGALEGLPEETRAIIELKHLEGLIFEDIAQQLGIPTNTAKTRYYRGIVALRSKLRAFEGMTEGDSNA